MKILSLHGWGAKKESMEPLLKDLDKLTPKTDILNPDLPGFGNEKEPPKPWGSKNYALWVENLCDNKKFNPDILIGHSNGGKIALRLITEGLIIPKYLILIAPSFIKHDVAFWKKILVNLFKPFKFLSKIKIFRKIFFKVLGSPDYHKLQSEIMKETFRKCVSEDLSDLLYKIKVPTLILWGTKDTYTPFSDAKILNKRITKSKLVDIKNGSHFIHKTHSKELATEIAKFIKKSV